MTEPELVDLESSIKQLSGVLSCVIVTDAEGAPSEIQAFTRQGVDPVSVQRAIRDEVARRGVDQALGHVFVFELEAGSGSGDREALEHAAALADAATSPISTAEHTGEPQVAARPAQTRRMRRPPLQNVALSSSDVRSEAEVALGTGHGGEVVGQASGEKTSHGLAVLAEATLKAVTQLVEVQFTLAGASLVSVVGRQAVLVVVTEQEGPEMVGAALVRGGPVSEAAVRATLDAVNRRVEILSRTT